MSDLIFSGKKEQNKEKQRVAARTGYNCKSKSGLFWLLKMIVVFYFIYISIGSRVKMTSAGEMEFVVEEEVI